MSFFTRKKEEPKQYNPEEIKRAVQEERPSQSVFVQPLPESVIYSPPISDVRIADSAPLFVKIEKYKEIIASVNEVKRFLTGMKQLFLVMNELQGIQQDSINMLKTSVQRLEKSIEWVDHSLVRPLGFEEHPHGEVEVKQIEQSLMDLQREISSLRKDLEKLG